MYSKNLYLTKRKLIMKSIVTLIAGLIAVSAFATEPAKTATPVAAPAPAASAKCDPAKDKTCKVEAKKEDAKPSKSQAPATKDAAKTAEPAKK
jgi:hypothetical protein